MTMEAIMNVLVFLLAAATILMGKYTLSLRRYVKELGKAYDEVTKGNYMAQINSSFSGDLGKAGKSFNLMTKEIYGNIETLKDRNSKLKAILKSISNGIVAIDKEQNVLLMNKAAKNIFDYHETDYEGRPFEMIVKDQRLLLCILDLFHKRERAHTQLHLGTVDYKINVDPIRLDDNDKIVIGAIVNIEDITERIKLETIRSDFVANVTHELKTPLTSINGFVETLKSNTGINKAMRTKFLDIIEVESNRLQRLIDDILILSFIEGNKSHYSNEPVNLADIINECINLVSETIKDKNVTIEFSPMDNEIYLKSNPDLMKQLILNLIDNAIKYSKEEGFVRLTLLEDSKKILFSVEDDGIGIPSEDIDRIFERFYRVDKARSKKVGGTGLGLAIVKHIVLNLNGNIKVHSELNKGSKFIIEFPKNDKDDSK